MYRDEEKKDMKLEKVESRGSESISEITIEEVAKSLNDIKNNKTAGNDQIIIEAIIAGGYTVIKHMSHRRNNTVQVGQSNNYNIA